MQSFLYKFKSDKRMHQWSSSRRIIAHKRVLFLSYLVLQVGIYSLLHGTEIRQMTEDQIIRKYPNEHFQKKDTKKILIWKPFLHDNIVTMDKQCLKKCKTKCVLTADKNEIANVDAVNFHLSDLWSDYWSIGTRSIIELPSYRTADQVWVISNMEPPQHLWGDLKVFNGLFNWTQWYKTDADIRWLYGGSYQLSKTEQELAVSKWSKRNIFREKSKGISGRISNCMDSNRRYTIINEMQKYVDIDMYGLCYNNPCGETRHEQDKSCNNLIKQYKFYLAFENNNCRDYITEKYWAALEREQIPIVNWKMLNRSIVIPNSYINIYDFPDMKSLTSYIKLVSENETLYNSYFDWKKSYARWHQCTSCQICEALHDEDRKAQVIEDLDSWVRNDICQKVGLLDDIKKHVLYYTFKLTGL